MNAPLPGPHWQQNIEALEQTQPALAKTLRHALLSDIGIKPEDIQHLHQQSQTHQENHLSGQIHQALDAGSELVIIFNMATGVVLPHLQNAFKNSFTWQLFIVEQNAIWLNALLSLHPFANAIEEQRILFSLADTEHLIQTIHQFGLGNRHTPAIFSGIPQANDIITTSLKQTLANNRIHQNETAANVLQYYHNKSITSAQRILMVDGWYGYIGQHMMDGIANAFALLGKDTARLRLEPPLLHEQIITKTYHAHALDALQRFKPDLIFCMQHDLDFLPPDFVNELNCPTVIYQVDYTQRELQSGSARRLYMGSSQEQSQQLQSQGLLTNYLPFACEVLPPKVIPRSQWHCPISFLGSGGTNKAERDYCRQFFESNNLWSDTQDAINALMQGANLDTLCAQPRWNTVSDEVLNRVRSFCIGECQRLRRLEFLEPLLPLGLQVFGGKWREATDNPAFQHAVRDPIPLAERFELYAASTINLNIHVADRHNSPNIRFFEVPASHGFLLTDYQESYSEFLSEGEVCYFTTPEDLYQKAEYYLNNSDAREPFIERGHQRVQAALTWKHWAEAFLQTILPAYLRVREGSDEAIPLQSGYPGRS